MAKKTKPDPRVLINWWLTPEKVLKLLKKDLTLLKEEDWVAIEEFDFGLLGYDYEEGLKFETSLSKLPALIVWLRKFHADHKLSILQEVTASSDALNENIFKQYGFKKDRFESWHLTP